MKIVHNKKLRNKEVENGFFNTLWACRKKTPTGID